MLAFFLPVMVLFFNKIVNSIFLVAMLFSIQAIVGLIVDIPSSSLADLFGRKNIMVIGGFLTVISFVLLAFSYNFIALVIFSIIFSFKNALYSGTQEALLYESVKELKIEKDYKKINGQLVTLTYAGGIIGAIAGGFMAKSYLRLPFILSIPIAFIVLISMFFLTEPKYEKEPNKSIFMHMKGATKILLENKQLLLLTLFGLLSFGLGESTFHLTQIYYNFVGLPIQFFGIVAAIGSFLGAIGALSSHTVSKKLGNKKTLILFYLLYAISLILATIYLGYIGVGFIALMSLFGGVPGPIMDYLINKEATSKNRATILSLNTFMSNLGYIIFAPLLGYLANLYTIAFAFKISGILLFLSVILIFFIKDKK